MTKVRCAGIVAICFVGLSAERASAQAAATFMLVPGIPGDSSTEGAVDGSRSRHLPRPLIRSEE